MFVTCFYFRCVSFLLIIADLAASAYTFYICLLDSTRVCAHSWYVVYSCIVWLFAQAEVAKRSSNAKYGSRFLFLFTSVCVCSRRNIHTCQICKYTFTRMYYCISCLSPIRSNEEAVAMERGQSKWASDFYLGHSKYNLEKYVHAQW